MGRGRDMFVWSSLVLCTFIVTMPRGWTNPTKTSWLSLPEIPQEVITSALASIGRMDSARASDFATKLSRTTGKASPEGQMATALLRAVAIEQAGDITAALAAYSSVAENSQGTPFGASAAFRLATLGHKERSAEEAEEMYKRVSREPPQSGWFHISDQWTWSTTRAAACHALLEHHSDRLSLRFLRFLHSKSPLNGAYTYMFIFFALALGVKVVELPLLMRTARLAAALKQLQPEIDAIQTSAVYDAQEKQQRLMALYKQRGVNPLVGCAILPVDLIFVIWAFRTLIDFSPRLVLDGSAFLWCKDITQFNWGIGILWIALSVVTTKVSQPQRPLVSLTLGSLVSGGALMWVAKSLSWPAYVFIFWGVLIVTGAIIGKALQAAARV